MKIIVAVLVVFFNTVCLAQELPDLIGAWKIKSGRLFINYEGSRSLNNNQVSFFADGTFELKSGLYYNILDLYADTYALGRYPFIFYGKRDKYRFKPDTLSFFNHVYGSWTKYKINSFGKDTIELIFDKVNITLIRKSNASDNIKKCSLKSIFVHVYEEEHSLGLYDVNYKVKYSDDDSLRASVRDTTGVWSHHKYKVPGSFKDICLGFSRIDVGNIKSNYPTSISERTIIDMEITMKNGKVIRSILENRDYPEELYFALVPVLYGHQRLVYADLPAVGLIGSSEQSQ